MNTSTYAKTIAIDFDGVINDYVGGWNNGVIHPDDRPIKNSIEMLGDIHDAGWRIIIHSVRCNTHGGKEDIYRYLRKFGLRPEVLFKLQFHGKPAAICYIDDRAIRFNGNWDEINPSQKPWYYAERGR